MRKSIWFIVSFLVLAAHAFGQTTQPVHPPAAFDVVPFEDFNGNFNIGVVAFGGCQVANNVGISLDIDRVDFSINSGNSFSVIHPATNPQTGISEYFLAVNSQNYSGAITVSATAWNTAGQSFAIPVITLYPRSSGYKSPAPILVSNQADLQKAIATAPDVPGDTIQCTGGVYQIVGLGGANLANKYWLTIEPAPNAKVAFVAAPGSGRITLHRNRIHYLQTPGSTFLIDTGQGYLNGVEAIWLDGINTTSASSPWLPAPPHDPGAPIRTTKAGFNGNYNLFCTDCKADEVIYGFVNALLVRNCSITRITGDAYQRDTCILSCSIDQFAGTTAHHADAMQTFGNMDNVIIYGLKATNLSGVQGIFWQPRIPSAPTAAMTNCAVVNYEIQCNDANGKGAPPAGQLQTTLSNLYFYNFIDPDQQVWFGNNATYPWAGTGIVFENSIFHPAMKLNAPPSGVTYINCKNGVSAKLNYPGIPASTTQPSVTTTRPN